MLPWELPELALEKAATALCNTQCASPGSGQQSLSFSCQELGKEPRDRFPVCFDVTALPFPASLVHSFDLRNVPLGQGHLFSTPVCGLVTEMQNL